MASLFYGGIQIVWRRWVVLRYFQCGLAGDDVYVDALHSGNSPQGLFNQGCAGIVCQAGDGQGQYVLCRCHDRFLCSMTCLLVGEGVQLFQLLNHFFCIALFDAFNHA